MRRKKYRNRKKWANRAFKMGERMAGVLFSNRSRAEKEKLFNRYKREALKLDELRYKA